MKFILDQYQGYPTMEVVDFLTSQVQAQGCDMLKSVPGKEEHPSRIVTERI